MSAAESGEPLGSARVWFALALAAALAVAIGVVLASAGGDGEAEPAAAAPAECLRAWNRDLSAREDGRHVRTFHRYAEAQVGYAETSGDEVAAVSPDPATGPCMVVFPRVSLDPEIEFAGFVVDGRRWASLSDTTPESTLSALQSRALEDPNASVTSEGELVAE